MLCGKVSGGTILTTDQAAVMMTKKGSNAYSLSAIRPRKGWLIMPCFPYADEDIVKRYTN